MRRAPRSRFWVETVLLVASVAFVAFTLLRPVWIEDVFGIEPDAGNGSLEWMLVAVGLAAVAILLLVTRLEWRRAAHA